MDDYDLKRQLKAGMADPDAAPQLAQTLRNFPEALLRWQKFDKYQPIDPANPRLRQLQSEIVESGAWRLLWMPAAFPYYRAETGPYADAGVAALTKILVFSSWQVVPKAIAMLTSYEAERRAVQLSQMDFGYAELRDRRSPLIRFAIDNGRPTAMNYLTLLYPSPTLAAELDPLTLLADRPQGEPVGESLLMERALAKTKELLGPIIAEYAQDQDVDTSWYWAAPLLLDRQNNLEAVGTWLDSSSEGVAWASIVRSSGRADADSHFSEHVDLANRLWKGEVQLGQPPEDLFPVVAKMGVASPAVTTLRSLMRSIASLEDLNCLLPAAARVAMGYRVMFNLPESICLLRGLQAGDETRYWEIVLDYCLHGNLQAVADEYVHILADNVGARNLTVGTAVLGVTDVFFSALSLRTVSLAFDEFVEMAAGQGFTLEDRKMRCRYAIRFGDGKDDEDGGIRKDQVRQAFNSPFHPFVLASTSVGQEGLDFHPYCHNIYHWNLPANPVDLEQREGRVNRYKGHAVRKNVALAAARAGGSRMTGDVWAALFEQAKATRPADTNDLVPYWLYEGDGDGYKINRHVPTLPMSREIGRAERLQNSTVAYRMVFGQPRQEDLLAFLERRYDSREEIEELAKRRIRLAPPETRC
jgi:hypothetical protein